MKIKIKATELVDPVISHVSLVERGANKSPFRILKEDDLSSKSSLLKRISAAFGGQTTEKAKVAAVICSPELEDLAKVVLHGYNLKIDNVEKRADRLIFKQDNFSEDQAGSFVAINEDVLVYFDRVIKRFEPDYNATDFDEGMASGDFFPSVWGALDVFANTVINIMYDATTKPDASELMSKAVKAFSNHITGLVADLPDVVFKMDVFGFNSKEMKMSLASKLAKGISLDEVMAGDLGGLLNEDVIRKFDEQRKPEDAGAKPEDKPEVKPEGETAETEAAAKAKAEAEGAEGTEPAKAEVTDGGEDENLSDSDKLAVKMIAALTKISDKLDTNSKLIKDFGDRLDAVEKDAKSAIEKADKPLVIDNGIPNEQLATLHGHQPLEKRDTAPRDDLWNGVMTTLDNF